MVLGTFAKLISRKISQVRVQKFLAAKMVKMAVFWGFKSDWQNDSETVKTDLDSNLLNWDIGETHNVIR